MKKAMHSLLSKCTRPNPNSPPQCFIRPHFPDTKHSKTIRPNQQQLDIPCIWADFPPCVLPREGDTAKLGEKKGCKAGTAEQVPIISPVCSITHTLQAILHFTSNCCHIYSTYTQMKRQFGAAEAKRDKPADFKSHRM